MYQAPQELRTYFVTTVTAQRRRLFQVETTARLMLDLLKANRAKGRFHLHAFVLMPDHIHILLTPTYEVSLEKTIQFIKGGFSFQLKSKLDVWERSYNESQIRDAEKFGACKQYIEHNPVRKRWVQAPEEYPFSSASQPDLTDAPPHWLL